MGVGSKPSPSAPAAVSYVRPFSAGPGGAIGVSAPVKRGTFREDLAQRTLGGVANGSLSRIVMPLPVQGRNAGAFDCGVVVVAEPAVVPHGIELEG